MHHAVSGEVYAVDSRTIFIKGFTYDGEGNIVKLFWSFSVSFSTNTGPAAYFFVGNSPTPSNKGGYRIRDERGGSGVLKKYRNKDINLTLPEGKTLR